MPLDSKLRRLALLLEPEVQRMLEMQARRTAGCEAHMEPNGLSVLFTRDGQMVWRTKSELIATLSPELGVFRWNWGQSHATTGQTDNRPRLFAAYREGERMGLSAFSAESLAVESEEEAELAAQLAARLAQADGLFRVEVGTRLAYYALFEQGRTPSLSSSGLPSMGGNDGQDRAGFRPAAVGTAHTGAYSILPASLRDSPTHRPTPFRSLPPPVAAIELSEPDLNDQAWAAMSVARHESVVDSAERRSTVPPRIPAQQPAPHRPSPEPHSNRVKNQDSDEDSLSAHLPPVIREPDRDVFTPVAQHALPIVHAAVPNFHQALVVVTLDDSGPKMRFMVQIVAVDPSGELHALDATRELLEATGKMIGDDTRSGNGRWRRLLARFSPTARGASVMIEVR